MKLEEEVRRKREGENTNEVSQRRRRKRTRIRSGAKEENEISREKLTCEHALEDVHGTYSAHKVLTTGC